MTALFVLLMASTMLHTVFLYHCGVEIFKHGMTIPCGAYYTTNKDDKVRGWSFGDLKEFKLKKALQCNVSRWWVDESEIKALNWPLDSYERN